MDWRHLGFCLFAGLFLFGGCQVGPDYQGPPPAPVAPTYTQSAETASPSEVLPQKDEVKPEPVEIASPDPAQLARWWTSLGDPILDTLIVQAASQNLSLRETALRICESRARLGIVRSDLFPQIDSDGSFYHQKRSTSTGGTVGPGGIVDSTSDLWSWGTNLSWEIDFFGRLHRLVEAAQADLDASVETYNDTLVILLADVATNYVNARTFQQQMAITGQNIQIQRRTLDIATQRMRAGTTSELDVAQARANLMSSMSELPQLEFGYRQALNRLSILLGCPPGQVDTLLANPVPIPMAPDSVAVGIPAELLRRRPDIREAERRVAAQTARIGAAIGELYPKFSITGTFGLDAQDFSRLFSSNSVNAGIGPGFRWNILNFGKFRCNIVAEEFLQRQRVAQYQSTVIQAAEEVDNALAGYVREKQRYQYLAQTVAAYARAVELSQIQYQNGTIDFQPVLDSQRALLNFQNQQIASQSNVVGNLILLYKAMGGGWQTPITPLPIVEGEAVEAVAPVPAPQAEPIPAPMPI